MINANSNSIPLPQSFSLKGKAQIAKQWVNLSDSQETPRHTGGKDQQSFHSRKQQLDTSMEADIITIPDEYDEDCNELTQFSNKDDVYNFQQSLHEYYEGRVDNHSSIHQFNSDHVSQTSEFQEQYLKEYELQESKFFENQYQQQQQQQSKKKPFNINTNINNNFQSTLGMRYNINTEEIIMEEDCETQQSHQNSPTNIIFDSPFKGTQKNVVVQNNKHIKKGNKIQQQQQQQQQLQQQICSKNNSSEKKQQIIKKRKSIDNAAYLAGAKLIPQNGKFFQKKRSSYQQFSQSAIGGGGAKSKQSSAHVTPSITPTCQQQSLYYCSTQSSKANLKGMNSVNNGKVKMNQTLDFAEAKQKIIKKLLNNTTNLFHNGKKEKKSMHNMTFTSTKQTSYISKALPKPQKKRTNQRSQNTSSLNVTNENLVVLNQKQQPCIMLDDEFQNQRVVRVAQYFGKDKSHPTARDSLKQQIVFQQPLQLDISQLMMIQSPLTQSLETTPKNRLEVQESRATGNKSVFSCFKENINKSKKKKNCRSYHYDYQQQQRSAVVAGSINHSRESSRHSWRGQQSQRSVDKVPPLSATSKLLLEHGIVPSVMKEQNSKKEVSNERQSKIMRDLQSQIEILYSKNTREVKHGPQFSTLKMKRQSLNQSQGDRSDLQCSVGGSSGSFVTDILMNQRRKTIEPFHTQTQPLALYKMRVLKNSNFIF